MRRHQATAHDRERAERFRTALYERTRVRWVPDVCVDDDDDALLIELLATAIDRGTDERP